MGEALAVRERIRAPMTPLTLAAALIVVTNGGTVSVQKDLSDHDCAEALSVVQYGQSIEEKTASDTAAKKAEEEHEAKMRPVISAYFAAHPKEREHCFPVSYGCATYDRDHGVAIGGVWGSVGWSTSNYEYTIKTAECVK